MTAFDEIEFHRWLSDAANVEVIGFLVALMLECSASYPSLCFNWAIPSVNQERKVLYACVDDIARAVDHADVDSLVPAIIARRCCEVALSLYEGDLAFEARFRNLIKIMDFYEIMMDTPCDWRKLAGISLEVVK